VPLRVALPDGARATQVACGANHSVVIDDQGRAITFGSDSAMQLGHLRETAWDAGHCAVPLPCASNTNVGFFFFFFFFFF
jgi:alpha-tubulin suppressor-like RCC1 family protein